MGDPCRTRSVALREANSFGSAGFQLYECGFLPDCAQWRYNGLCNPFWRLYYNSRKGASVVVEGKPVSLSPEELIMIPENTPFNSCGAAGVPHFWIHFSPPVSLGLVPEVRHVALTRLLAAGISEARDEIMKGGTDTPAGKRRLVHLCLCVLHGWLAELPPMAHPALPPQLGMLLEYIDRSLGGEGVSNAALAAHAGMSVEGFIRWFKEWTGGTPARYVAGRRILKACHLLLLTNGSIEEIAEATGFANRHHFSRVFLRHTRQSPALFRREQQRC